MQLLLHTLCLYPLVVGQWVSVTSFEHRMSLQLMFPLIEKDDDRARKTP